MPASRSPCRPALDMPARLSAVLEAIYGAYAIDWLDRATDDLRDVDRRRGALAGRAAGEPARDEPEAWGLAALLTFAQSRAPARAVRPWPPLDEQDPALWDAELIAEGRALLRRASALGAPARPLPAGGGDPGGALRPRPHRRRWMPKPS